MDSAAIGQLGATLWAASAHSTEPGPAARSTGEQQRGQLNVMPSSPLWDGGNSILQLFGHPLRQRSLSQQTRRVANGACQAIAVIAAAKRLHSL